MHSCGNGKAKLFFVLIQEEGSAVNRRFNIKIPCKNTNYTAKEISRAKEPFKGFDFNSPEFKKKLEDCYEINLGLLHCQRYTLPLSYAHNFLSKVCAFIND